MITGQRIIFTTIVSGTASISLSLFLPYWIKKVGIRRVLLSILVLIILWMTLFSRDFRDDGIRLMPFWNYSKWNILEVRHEILQNIIAFIPLGALLRGSFAQLKKRQIILICCAFSIVIEATQYFFGRGLCEMDDIMHNTLGGAIGVLLYGNGVMLFHNNRNR